MSCHNRFVCISVLVVSVVYLVECDVVQERRCYSTELNECWTGETCAVQKHATQGGEKDGICVCLRSHQRNDKGYCLPVKVNPLPTPAQVNSDSKSSSASIAAGILVPLFFVGVAVLVVLARRYGLWQRLRQPRIRHYDTALVGGDLEDDPPIA